MAVSRSRRGGASAFDSRFSFVLLESHDCAVCGQAMPFEAPICDDGHEDACPDRICTGCGAVLVVGPAPIDVRRSA